MAQGRSRRVRGACRCRGAWGGRGASACKSCMIRSAGVGVVAALGQVQRSSPVHGWWWERVGHQETRTCSKWHGRGRRGRWGGRGARRRMGGKCGVSAWAVGGGGGAGVGGGVAVRCHVAGWWPQVRVSRGGSSTVEATSSCRLAACARVQTGSGSGCGVAGGRWRGSAERWAQPTKASGGGHHQRCF